MTISLVINTCALGNDAQRRSSRGHGPTYAARAALLEHTILPAVCADPNYDEIIVAGEWKDGPDYRYAPCVGSDHNVWDQCEQKHAAAPTGDICVFLCDDHLPAPDFSTRLREGWARNTLWDVLSPNRILPDGSPAATGWPEGYVHAHCLIMTRRALTVCPWTTTWKYVRGTWGWDQPATALWSRMGLRIQTDYNLLVCDVEDNQFERAAANTAQLGVDACA